MARQIIVVGMAKTGTMHIASLYKKLFEANGIEGIAQHQGVLDKLSPDINFIDADWDKSRQMKIISERYPCVRFIILYRGVLECCISLNNFYIGKGHPDKDFTADQLVDRYWKSVYNTINEQLQHINPKPLFMRSQDYFNGRHNPILLSMFGLPINPDNHKIINDHLKVPINRGRGYGEMSLSDDVCKECDQIGETVRVNCIHPWIEKDLYE